MKSVFIFILLVNLLISCKNTETTVNSLDKPEIELTDNKPIESPESSNPLVIEVEKTISVKNRGEGIGLGNTHSIGHGAGHYEEKKQLKIIKVVNSRTSSTSTNMGHVIYKIPTEMKVRNTYEVIVRISKTTATIFENIDGEIKTTTIPVTETMEVKLIDPSPDDRKMFDVIPDNDAIQLVENNESVTQWSWNVTPIITGKAQLKINIAVITNGNKKETVYEDIVNVNSNLKKEIPFFFGEYWQWMLSTLVIPFGIWFYNKKKKEN